MLAIQPTAKRGEKCIPNVLPCRINHNGPVNATNRYWSPTTDADGKTTAYFRGRKLHSKSVNVPEGYRGVVLATTEETLPASDKEIVNEEDDEADEEDEPKPVKVLKELASFDEVVVWGHESIPDSESDAYLKTMEEWIAFAQTMHSYDLSDGATEQGSRAS